MVKSRQKFPNKGGGAKKYFIFNSNIMLGSFKWTISGVREVNVFVQPWCWWCGFMATLFAKHQILY